MADPRLEQWAKVLVDYSIGIKPGETVAINAGVAGEPLVRAVYRQVLAAGACPAVFLSLSGLQADLLTYGSDEQLSYITPIEHFSRLEANVLINIGAETNTRSLSAVDPARQIAYNRARHDFHQHYRRRSESHELEWVSTLYPTDAYAQDADMATADFAEFVFRACKLNAADPVAAWQEASAEQQRLADWLTGKQEIRLKGPGTDLTIAAGPRWVNCDGRRNFPDGEVFTDPVVESAEGTVRFSYPVVTAGREVDDVRLKFENGKVVDASAAKNEPYLIAVLDTDPGARYLCEFAFGCNYDVDRFTKIVLFDEKIGGTVHMAIGAPYDKDGETVRSLVHWDMICDLRQGGTVDVDGQPFMRNGQFVV